MKFKSLITIFCVFSVSASGVEAESWNITQDAFIDGKIDSSAESVAIKIKHINNIFNLLNFHYLQIKKAPLKKRSLVF